MRQATVAIEDRRFYKHGGVDFEGVVRAAIKNISSGETVEGGSTLTMQLIRNLYTEDRARNGIAGYKRKIREAKLASELEDRHPGPRGKGWILNQYLNNVPYGTVGGQTPSASRRPSRVFFDKPARRLTLAESALLAGLPQAPSHYNPFLDPQAPRSSAATRSCAQMAERGLHHRRTRPTGAQRAPLGVKKSRYYAKRRESYFFDYVKQQLINEYGAARVRQGGLKVYTTIDLKLQQEARKAIASRLADAGRPVRGARLDRPATTATSRRWPRSTEYAALEVQPRRAGQAPAGLDLQGHGADDRAARRRRHPTRRPTTPSR